MLVTPVLRDIIVSKRQSCTAEDTLGQSWRQTAAIERELFTDSHTDSQTQTLTDSHTR